jgi:hypothetical protein
MNVKNGVCGMQFDRRDIPMNKFVVTCLESQFHVFDARTQHPQKVRAGTATAAAEPAGVSFTLQQQNCAYCLRPLQSHYYYLRHVRAYQVLQAALKVDHLSMCCALQGFASVSQSVSTGSTLWGAHHMPQNRDAVMLAAGDGSVSLWKYQYPDQRTVKVRSSWR